MTGHLVTLFNCFIRYFYRAISFQVQVIIASFSRILTPTTLLQFLKTPSHCIPTHLLLVVVVHFAYNCTTTATVATLPGTYCCLFYWLFCLVNLLIVPVPLIKRFRGSILISSCTLQVL